MTRIANIDTHKEPFVTVAELAMYWRVGECTVQYQVSKGALPATRVGRTIRIRTDDARRFGRIEDVISGPIGAAN